MFLISNGLYLILYRTHVNVGIKSVCYYEKSAPEGVLDVVRKECEGGGKKRYANCTPATCEW